MNTKHDNKKKSFTNSFKVCILAPLPPPAGGIAKWTQRMLSTDLKNNWKIVLVNERTIGKRTFFVEHFKRNYFHEIIRCSKIWYNLWIALKDKNTLVVHCCIPAETLSLLREIISLFITHVRKRCFITHFRCTTPNTVKSKFNSFLYKTMLKKSDGVILLNRQSLDYSLKIYKEGNYKVIPNFVNTNEIFNERVYSKEIRTVLYVGGVIPEKGCNLIFDAARELQDIEFRLVGSIGIPQDNLPSNVVLCGEKPFDYIQKEYKNADAFLFFSKYLGEGFSNALAEAMAASLPCIVTDWAANPDMIKHNKGGIVLKKDNVKNVLDAFTLIKDQNTRYKMGEFNRKRVQELYSHKKVTSSYVDFYEKTIKNKLSCCNQRNI